jgi:hypothetical protein
MLNVRPTPTALESSSEPSLYMAELHHRVTNEYARAIASASVTASRASSKEAMAVLETVIQHLVQLAAVHRLLLPPAVEESADLGDYLARLCQAKQAAELERHGTTLHLSVESIRREAVLTLLIGDDGERNSRALLPRAHHHALLGTFLGRGHLTAQRRRQHWRGEGGRPCRCRARSDWSENPPNVLIAVRSIAVRPSAGKRKGGPSHLLVDNAESARGISPRAAHRAGREPLDSSGSCHRAMAAAFR